METDPLPDFTVPGPDIQSYPVVTSAVASILLMVILLFVFALISGAETAYFSLDPRDRQKRDKWTPSVLRNLEDPEKLLATLLIANNFAMIAIVIIAFYGVNLFFSFSEAGVTGYVLPTVAVVFMLLLVVKIVSQAFTAKYTVQIARLMAVPLQIMMHLCHPLNRILYRSSQEIRKRVQNYTPEVSLDDLSEALELTGTEDNDDDKEILEGIVNFGSKNVHEIMRAPDEVVSLDLNDTFSKVLQVINVSGYSRIPAHSGSFSNIQGILYIKDLLPFVHGEETFRWQSIVRPPFFVPETKKIDDLLEEFQKNKVHMAVVTDEHGKTSGIVTLEDVLEEIVGDIEDEND